MSARARYLAPLVILAALALPPGAGAAEDPRYGAALSPVPLIVEDWNEPEVTLTNLGDVTIDAELTIDGEGWALASSEVADLAAGDTAAVPILAIGDGSARIVARITTDAAGMDQAVLVLESVARHAEWYEGIPWHIVALGAVLAALAAIYAARRRREAA